jgi:hypothetical protein
MPKSASSPIVRWHLRHVEEEKRAIKAELDALGSGKDTDARLRHISARIGELEADDQPVPRLRRFVYVVSALVHHSRFGGLTEAQVRNLEDLGHALLFAEKIHPIKSRLAYLYGELHLALSQIHRKTGKHWLAAWEQQISLHLSGKTPPGGVAFQYLSMGIRAARLGFGPSAVTYFKAAEDLGLDPRPLLRARLGRIRALRLAGELAQSAELAAATTSLQMSNDEQLELVWEESCRTAQAKLDLGEMMRLTARGSSHHLPIYLVEAFLWAHAVPERRWEKKLVRVRTMIRKKLMRREQLGIALEAIEAVETAYDSAMPMAARLQKVGRILARTNEFVTLDLELLFLAAVGRWLARSHLFSMASLVLQRYKALNVLQTNRTGADGLGLVQDLLEKPWCAVEALPANALTVDFVA